jgi:peptidoglycan/xylan/chitin deacetylase (PgdA/CDA1 family)
MAITIDDLSNTDLLPGSSDAKIGKNIIAALKENKIPAAIAFINGMHADKVAEKLQNMKDWNRAGFWIGNHTFTHQDREIPNPVSSLEKDIELDDNFIKNNQLMMGPQKWFRYPNLDEPTDVAVRNRIRAYLKSLDYKIAQTTISFSDWVFNTAYLHCMQDGHHQIQADKIKTIYVQAGLEELSIIDNLAEKIAGHKVKHVLLVHYSELNAVALGDLLKAYKKANVNFIDPNEAFKDSLYTTDVAQPKYTGMGIVRWLAIEKGLEQKWNSHIQTAMDFDSQCRAPSRKK